MRCGARVRVAEGMVTIYGERERERERKRERERERDEREGGVARRHNVAWRANAHWGGGEWRARVARCGHSGRGFGYALSVWGCESLTPSAVRMEWRTVRELEASEPVQGGAVGTLMICCLGWRGPPWRCVCFCFGDGGRCVADEANPNVGVMWGVRLGCCGVV